MVPDPLTSVHVPLAGTVGTLPASTVLLMGVHKPWSGPAFAAGLAASYTNTVT